MTLRLTLEIVPFGREQLKETIRVFNIHNTGLVEELPFGMSKYSYSVDVEDKEGPRVDLIKVDSHSRRDDAEELARKVQRNSWRRAANRVMDAIYKHYKDQ